MYNDKSQCNYDFVPFNPPDFYKYAGKGDLSGYAELKLVTIENVYIGSGFSRENNKSFILETIKDFDNKPIIPASSIKGTVRNVCSAISDGCLPNEKKQNLIFEPIRCSAIIDDNKKIIRRCCIVCDMFGMIGRVSIASKISFIDFKPTNNFSISNKFVNQQFSPNINNSKYKNGNKFKGYKFYCTNHEVNESNQSNQKINIEVIKPKSEFVGKVFFKNLTEDELQLLLFACGISKDINLKIGGFKNQGLGKVSCLCEKLVINQSQEDPILWAKNYPKGEYGMKFKSSIEKYKKIVR